MNFFRKRRILKDAQEALRQADLLRNMREDIMTSSQLESLNKAELSLKELIKANAYDSIDKCSESLYEIVFKITPKRSFPSVRENIEIFVVAIVVAMAFRTYFFQPFKIPTGSMQPTLNGITSTACSDPSIFDHVPLKFVKWFITGDWYKEIKVKRYGICSGLVAGGHFKPASAYCEIENITPDGTPLYSKVRYRVPRDAKLNYSFGTSVKPGDVLWSGYIHAGDHLFVDKIRWNFVRPKRGDVIVFHTDKIKDIEYNTFYIKRLIGLPGETVSIDPPDVYINGKVLDKPQTITRVARSVGPYSMNSGYGAAPRFPNASTKMTLGPKSYLPFGDNTGSSWDGRYWGSVPEESVVGPALFVYWPFTKHWGYAGK